MPPVDMEHGGRIRPREEGSPESSVECTKFESIQRETPSGQLDMPVWSSEVRDGDTNLEATRIQMSFKTRRPDEIIQE